MIEWLIKNKEWIFSGTGATIIGAIITILVGRKKNKKKKIHQNINRSNAIQVGAIEGNTGNIEITVNPYENNIIAKVSEKDIAKLLIIFLEDKRVLYSPYAVGCPGGVLESIVEIREHLKDQKNKLEDTNWLYGILTNMQQAIYEFSYYACKTCENPASCNNCEIYNKGCIAGLNKFRCTMIMEIVEICNYFKMEIPKILSLNNR